MLLKTVSALLSPTSPGNLRCRVHEGMVFVPMSISIAVGLLYILILTHYVLAV